MHNPGGFGELGFAQAVLRVEAALREAFPSPPRRLTPDEIRSTYTRRGFERGWRIEMLFSDGETRSIDLLVSRNFPTGYPRTALVDGPGQLVWPHVEYDGILCLLPVMAEVDAEDPGAVAVNLMARSARLIEDLLEGSIVERDFREEFLTYWFYATDTGAPRIQSLIDPVGPSRAVRVWRDGKGLVVVGESQASLETWLTNRFDKLPGRKAWHTEPAAFLWLAHPPISSEYPATGANLLELAKGADDDAFNVLETVAGSLPNDVTVLIGAEGRGGPGIVAATTTAARRAMSRHGRVEAPLTKGFSPNAMPRALAALRTYSAAPVLKSVVERADATWIHGRGKDARTPCLLGATAVVIGCGSVGSSVAARLARAGFGTLHFVDPNPLKWSNVGRHELGARSVGLSKAIELAKRLQQDFPHLKITGHAVSAQSLISGYEGLLQASDLIIATTGSWDADGALNRWHIAEGRSTPIVYGWTESLAAAGHAVVICQEGGCLRCGIGPTGVPSFQATSWPDGGPTIEEPACGNHFHPYGAVELGFVVDLIAETALQTLLARPTVSRHDLWLGAASRLTAGGGQWTKELLALAPAALVGGQRLTRDWPNLACSACAATSPISIAAE